MLVVFISSLLLSKTFTSKISIKSSSLFLSFFTLCFFFSKQERFASFPYSMMTIFVMTLGELNYADVLMPWDKREYATLSNVLFIMFVLGMPIIIMNMLVRRTFLLKIANAWLSIGISTPKTSNAEGGDYPLGFSFSILLFLDRWNLFRGIPGAQDPNSHVTLRKQSCP